MSQPPSPRFMDPTTPPSLFTLVIITAIGALSVTVFVPSINAIVDHFSAPYWQVQFLISGYLIATAFVQLCTGPLSDFLGRRVVLMAAMAIFTVASVVCAFAPNITVLLIARLVQAVSATSMVISRAAVRDTTAADQAASRIGYITMAMALVPMAAPPLGGQLQEMFGWQSSFWVMAIAGLLCFILAWRDLGETAPGKGQSFASQFAQYPALLSTRRFWGYALTMGSATGGFFALLGGTPVLAQEIYGLSAREFGFYFAFTPSGYLLGNFLTGRFGTRIGINRMVLIGAGIPMLGMSVSLILNLSGLVHPLTFFGCAMLIGIGNGIVLPNALAGVMNIRPELAGTGAGLSGAIMTVLSAAVAAITASSLDPGNALYVMIGSIMVLSAFGLVLAIWVFALERRALNPS